MLSQEYYGNIEQGLVYSILDNIARGFYICNVVSRVIRQHSTGFFPCNVVYSILDNIARGFYICNVVSRVIRQHWTGFFPCNVVYSILDNIVRGFYICNAVSRVIRQHWTGFFHVQCCLEPLGQHCTRCLSVQDVCLLDNIIQEFSCAALPGTSQTTLHRFFTLHYWSIFLGKITYTMLCLLSWHSIAQGYCILNNVQIPLRQHCTIELATGAMLAETTCTEK